MKYALSFLGVLVVTVILAGGGALTVMKPIADSVNAARSVNVEQSMLAQHMDIIAQ